MTIVWCHGHIGYDIYKDQETLPCECDAASLIAYAPSSKKLRVGGKALNFAYALARAGVSPHLSGFIGNDDLGERLESDCVGLGIPSTLYRLSPKTFAFWIDETGPKVLQDGTIAQDSVFFPSIPPFHTVVLHAINDWQFLPLLSKKAKAAGKLLVFNPAPIENLRDLTPVHQSDLLIANESEATVIAAMAGIRVKEVSGIAGALQEKFKKNVVVTLGERGVSAAFDNRRYYQEPFPSRAVDTVGAGDAFLGFFLASYLQRKSIFESLQMGAAAGSLVCEVKGAIRADLSVLSAQERISRNIRTKHRSQPASQILRYGS